MSSGGGVTSGLSKLRNIRFLTGNRHKFREAQAILSEYGLEIEMVQAKMLEIQSEDIEIIAATSIRDASRRVSGPVILEDAGLFINRLNGFPGPYSAYVFKTLGCEGVLKLLADSEDRGAEFKSAIAYADGETPSKVRTFLGVTGGRISVEMRGKRGFGFDPIFIPEDRDRTFGEVDLKEKNRYSHRARSLRAFATWYLSDL